MRSTPSLCPVLVRMLEYIGLGSHRIFTHYTKIRQDIRTRGNLMVKNLCPCRLKYERDSLGMRYTYTHSVYIRHFTIPIKHVVVGGVIIIIIIVR